MFKKEIEAYFEKLFASQNLSSEKELSPEEFNAVMAKVTSELLANSEDFYKMDFLKEKAKTLLDEYLTRITYESNEQNNDQLSEFFLVAVFYLSSASYLKTEEAKKLFTVSQDLDLFRKESLPRILILKDQLEKKHSSLEKIVSTQFSIFISEIEKEVQFIEDYLRSLSSIEVNGYNLSTTFFPTNQQGRPYDLFIDLVLLGLHDTASKVNPKKNYANVIIPSMIFLSDVFPDILDVNDYCNYDKLRQRISYIQKKYSQEETDDYLPGE